MKKIAVLLLALAFSPWLAAAQNQSAAKSLSIQVLAISHKVSLSWGAPATICLDGGNGCGTFAGYKVYRSTVSGSGYTLVTSTATTIYVDQTAQAGQTYFYVATCYTSTGESAYSNEVSVAVPTP